MRSTNCQRAVAASRESAANHWPQPSGSYETPLQGMKYPGLARSVANRISTIVA
jgi:hypothetical protein